MGMIRRRGKIWWIKFYVGGVPREESSHSEIKDDARTLLKDREGDVAHGQTPSKRATRLRFEDAAKDVINDYTVNGKKSLAGIKRRITLGLLPHFRGRRMASITSTDIREYVTKRLKDDASNATINRELAALKRMFTLAEMRRPKIVMLREDNARAGFFEREQFVAVRAKLPAPLQPLATVAYWTGWRVRSELQPLEWRNVDLKAETIRLDPGSTKNREGRVFMFGGITEMAEALAQLDAERKALKKQGTLCPTVFQRHGKPIKSFRKAWQTACKAAGCPGRIPHDFRRTAVRNLERAGVARSTAMQMVGHKTEAIYRRYAIVSETDLREAGAKLGLLGAKKTARGDNSGDNRGAEGKQTA